MIGWICQWHGALFVHSLQMRTKWKQWYLSSPALNAPSWTQPGKTGLINDSLSGTVWELSQLFSFWLPDILLDDVRGYMSPVITSYVSNKNSQPLNVCKGAPVYQWFVSIITHSKAKADLQTGLSGWWLRMKCSVYWDTSQGSSLENLIYSSWYYPTIQQFVKIWFIPWKTDPGVLWAKCREYIWEDKQIKAFKGGVQWCCWSSM